MSDPKLPPISTDGPPIFLHCGMHKTGTTYIQTLLGQNREALEAHGILYPKDPTGTRYAHHGLAQTLAGNRVDKQACIDWLTALAAEPRPILLSSEGFSKLGDAALEQVRDALPGRTVVPIVFVREWSGALASRWQQMLYKQPQSLPDYLVHNLLRALDVDFINYAIVLDRLSTVFGREKIVAVAYDNALNSSQDIVDLLLGDILGMTLRKADLDLSGVKRNQSMSPEDAALLRLMHMVFGPDGEEQRTNIMHRRPKAVLIDEVPELRALSEYRETFPVARGSRFFDDLNAALFASYGDRFINPAEGRIFAELGRKEVVAVSLENWLAHHPAAMIRLNEISALVAEGKRPPRRKVRRRRAAEPAATETEAATKAGAAAVPTPAGAAADNASKQVRGNKAIGEAERHGARQAQKAERKKQRKEEKAAKRAERPSAFAALLAKLGLSGENKRTARKARRKAKRAERRAAGRLSPPPPAPQAPDENRPAA